MRTLKTPDTTVAQLAALAAASMQVLVAFGVHLSKQQVNAIEDLVQATLVVVGADAVIRVARNLKREAGPAHAQGQVATAEGVE